MKIQIQKSDFDEFEIFNNNSIKLIDQINYNNITENENFIITHILFD